MANEKKSILSRGGKAILGLFGLLIAYILIGNIDGPLPKDDDLYLPPPTNIPDEQNVRVALMEIFGSCFPYLGPESSVLQMYVDDDHDSSVSFIKDFEDNNGNVIVTVSNQVDFITLLDAALATNECITTALARAAERPLYVNDQRSLKHSSSRLDWRQCYYYRRARHKRFLETKRYDEAIDGARISLELSDKVLNGYCGRSDKLSALRSHRDAIEHLTEIASLKDADENMLAKINTLIAKHDLKDLKAFCYKMLREDYSCRKHLYLNYSSLSLTDRYKSENTNTLLQNTPLVTNVHIYDVLKSITFPLLDFCLHPNRTLSLLAKATRKQLVQLDNCNTYITKVAAEHNREPMLAQHRRLGSGVDRALPWSQIVTVAKCLLPNALGEFIDPEYESRLESDLKHTATVFRKSRAIQLMVACRQHFLKTNKLPETTASIAPEILPEPILDPVFNIPYEIKSWRDGDMMHVAAFAKDGIIARMSWPVK